MTSTPTAGYLESTEPWESRAGRGPVLRGRRTATQPTMLHFLHGNGFSGGVYWPFLRLLPPDFGLFCHDIEGHGASDAPARFSGTPAIIERVPQVIAEQCAGSSRLIGIGHSYGAAVTLAVAARHPGLFERLVLLDPILMPTPIWWGLRLASALGRNPMANAARRRRHCWPSRDAVAERLRNRGIYRGWPDDALHHFVEHATCDADDSGRQLSCPREIEAAIYEQPVYPWRLLPRVRCEVLILYGRETYDFIAPAMQRARRLNPRITIESIAGGHCFMLEHPHEAAARVNAFIRLADDATTRQILTA